jgi:hypothetical protein
MKDRERDLLQAIFELETAIRRRGEPFMDHGPTGEARTRAGREFLRERDCWQHGPRISELHGDGYDSTGRRRVARALLRLEAEGLVKLAGWPNITHVKLTRKGREAIRSEA